MAYMAQPGAASLGYGSWDAPIEGAQNFASYSSQGADMAHDSGYTYSYAQEGVQTRKDHTDSSLGSYSQQQKGAAGPVPVQRSASQASNESYKTRTIRASSHRSRPRIQTDNAGLSQGADVPMELGLSSGGVSAVTSSYDMTGGDVYSTNGVLSSTMSPVSTSMANMSSYYQTDGSDGNIMGIQQQYLPLYQQGLTPASFGSSLAAYSPDLGLASLQHVDPACTQMHMDFEPGMPAISPATWDSISSRPSSPGLGREDDVWSNSQPIVSSPTESHGSNTSFIRHPTATDANSIPGTSLMDDFSLTAALHHRSNSENDSARDDPLYKEAVVQADGLYHCPWEADGSCNHRPEKLKCNYDKYVDSHLKPYRCTNISCENARFSSTACLLRHEREAHAMHGHGDKPFRCTYDGCDRSQPGNGFPRQWNLRDHMRRVHHDAGGNATSVPHGAAAAAAAVYSSSHTASSSQTVAKGRKRKKDSMSSHGSASGTGSSSRKSSSSSSKAHHGSSSKSHGTSSESRTSRSGRNSSPSQEMAASAAAAVAEAARKAALLQQQQQQFYNDFYQHKKALSDLVMVFTLPDDPQMAQRLIDAEMHISAIRQISTDMAVPRSVDVFHDPYLQAFAQQSGSKTNGTPANPSRRSSDLT